MADELDDSFFEEEPTGFDETEHIFDDEVDELDEIIIENPDESRSNRPFLMSLLGMGALGLGAIMCLVLSNSLGFIAEPTISPEMLAVTQQFAERIAANNTTEAQNVYVTQTLAAREATATAIANIPTNTPPPTETPVPTNSPVPQGASAGSESADDADNSEDGDAASAEGEGTDESGDTDTADGSEDSDSDGATAGTDADSGATGEDTNADGTDGSVANDEDIDDQDRTTSGSGASGETTAPDQLPNTGFSIGGTLALAFGLLVLLFGARRLRLT